MLPSTSSVEIGHSMTYRTGFAFVASYDLKQGSSAGRNVFRCCLKVFHDEEEAKGIWRRLYRMTPCTRLAVYTAAARQTDRHRKHLSASHACLIIAADTAWNTMLVFRSNVNRHQLCLQSDDANADACVSDGSLHL